MNKDIKWKGEERPRARILTMLTMPNENEDEVMSHSGKNGIIIDHHLLDAQKRAEAKRSNINFPEEWTMRDVQQKVDAMPAAARKETRGNIPKYRGYA